MAGGAGWSSRLDVHALAEVLEASFGEFDVSRGERSGALLDRMEEDEEGLGALIEDPVQIAPVVTPQLAQLAVDL